jgi:hypothetical protein
MIAEQLAELRILRERENAPAPTATPLPNGGHLISVPGVALRGWNRPVADVLFVAPPGYPGAQPDCFWVEPTNFRLANGSTPANTNDSNPIPGDINPGRSTTWFSWHVQAWNPNRSTLATFFNVIQRRLKNPQ